jgi:hypothetical protein
MSLRREPPPRLPPAAILSSKGGCLLQSSITISQVGLYSMLVLAWACFFVITLISLG